MVQEVNSMETPKTVSRQEWEAAHQRMLAKEKALTQARDALAAEHRQMPWLAVEKAYAFDGPEGKAGLLDLFDGRRQLIVYRAFFEPGAAGWPEQACRGCARVAGRLARADTRDTACVLVSRAPPPDIARLQAQMGWEMPWYTLTDDFGADFGVDEEHGANIFIRSGDRIFRTYFVHGCGDEALGGIWSYLDITALGRQGAREDSPADYRLRHINDEKGTVAMTPAFRPEKNGPAHRMPEEQRFGAAPARSRKQQSVSNDCSSEPGCGSEDGGGGATSFSLADCLCFAASPIFAVMALLTVIYGGGPPEISHSAMQAMQAMQAMHSMGSIHGMQAAHGIHEESLLTGMTGGMLLMYVLMCLFHLPPWLNLLRRKRQDRRLALDEAYHALQDH